MFTDWYARWMYAWETRLTMRDENRVVRPLEWGFEWIVPFLEAHGLLDSVNATGGLLVSCVGLVILGLKKIELADYLPSLVVAPVLAWLLS